MSLFKELQATNQNLQRLIEHGSRRGSIALRNDWRESLRRGAQLCYDNGHVGDADTINDILEFLSGERPEPQIYSKPVAVLELSQRASHCLRSEGVATVGQLMRQPISVLKKVPNLGQSTLNNIIQTLEKHGLQLQP